MSFQPFDSEASRGEYRRHLPHWTQPGCTYFLTFRLADSLPTAVLHAWNEERQCWLAARGLNSIDEVSSLTLNEQKEFQKHFNRLTHAHLDSGHGACLLRYALFARIVADALLFFDGVRCAVGDFVVMPNHVHLLATPFGEWKLRNLLHSWKRHSAKEINRLRGVKGSLWMDETFDHAARNEDALRYYRHYIRRNPMVAGLKKGEYLLGCGSDADQLP